MRTFMRIAEHGIAKGQEKRPSFAESLLPAFEVAGDIQGSLLAGVSTEPFRN
jgi:hypothetical protein